MPRQAPKGRKPFPKPAPRPKPAPATSQTPPHDEKAERLALGCVLMAASESEKGVEGGNLFERLSRPMFHTLTCQIAFDVLAALHKQGNPLTVFALLDAAKHSAPENLCGIPYADLKVPFRTLTENVASWTADFPVVLSRLQTLASQRAAARWAAELADAAGKPGFDLEALRTRMGEMSDAAEKTGKRSGRPILKAWKPGEILKVQIDPRFCLIGDNEICSGYDGVAVIAGPGSSGKSLTVTALALAGAIGAGHWMGRKVHRKFRVLVIQAENGLSRLKGEMEAVRRMHPDIDLDEWLRVTEPPEGGLRFADADFRPALARMVSEFKPDLVIIDPWSHVGCEDSSTEVINMIAMIRSCFPAGDDCPGLLIVAHTKKPRAEEVRRGRSLVNQVSGSIALVNTARTVYVLLPWTEETTDERIYWTCAKLNNGQMYGATVWKRRFGTFFEHDPSTPPETWGQTDEGDGRAVANKARRAVTIEMVRDIFKATKRDGMKKGELVDELVNRFSVKRTPAYDGIKYLVSEGFLNEAAGIIALAK